MPITNSKIRSGRNSAGHGCKPLWYCLPALSATQSPRALQLTLLQPHPPHRVIHRHQRRIQRAGGKAPGGGDFVLDQQVGCQRQRDVEGEGVGGDGEDAPAGQGAAAGPAAAPRYCRSAGRAGRWRGDCRAGHTFLSKVTLARRIHLRAAGPGSSPLRLGQIRQQRQIL